MFSDSPNQISNKHKVEWYESPSNNDLTNSGHRQYTQRIPLRTQHEANLRKEAALKSREIKTGDFDLSADDDDDFNNDSLFAKSLMKPLSVDKTSPDLVWKKEKTEDNTLASKMLAHLPGKNITQEFLNLSKIVSSEPSTSLANSDIISSSSSMN
uniref:Uncharacterized protein n=1 Tax=Panagrolaimus superbus TaxID=310955 RepID=A0A914ZFD6_9BILA